LLRAACGTQRSSELPPLPSPEYGRSADAPGGLWDPPAVTVPDPQLTLEPSVSLRRKNCPERRGRSDILVSRRGRKNEAASVHYASRWLGGDVAPRRARAAAGHAGDRFSAAEHGCWVRAYFSRAPPRAE